MANVRPPFRMLEDRRGFVRAQRGRAVRGSSLLVLFSASQAASLLLSSTIPGRLSRASIGWIREASTEYSSGVVFVQKRRFSMFASIRPLMPGDAKAGALACDTASKFFQRGKKSAAAMDMSSVFGGDVGDGYPTQPNLAPPGPGETEFYLRFFYHGGKLTRDGILRRKLLREPDNKVVEGRTVLQWLDDEGVDRSTFTPHAFAPDGLSWVEITDSMTFEVSEDAPNRIDIKIMPPPLAESLVKEQEDGYFLMGALGLKNEPNLGTLWRSSFQLGAAGIFLIGSRFSISPTDVLDVQHKIPLVEYNDWNHFASTAPKGARWVAIEMGGEPLETYEHPKRAVYILGSEDNGLPSSVVRACHDHVALPSVRYASYNAAVAGSIVMYDRVAKLAQANSPTFFRKGGKRPKKPPAQPSTEPGTR